ncbi:MAG: helix-hairpin-helix domain-containing protein [Candidatus Heimdallarchaeota archaeon]|nr:helix-hairpin-helix domain-containing protein [Candidatus Heimdallarchaeota archaeon]
MASSDKLDSKLITLLKDSILISTNLSNDREIVFDVIFNESDEWSRYYLYIRDPDNFYYQRYESSLQRSGLVNLRRINIKNNQAEWISEVNDWSNLFTKESGIEFKLYNGSIFRFVGSNLSLEQSFVEGPIDSIAQYTGEKPDHIEQSKAIVIVNEKFTKPVVDTIIEIVNVDENDSGEDQEIIKADVIDEKLDDHPTQMEYVEEKINPEYEEALNQIDKLTDKEIIESVDLPNESEQDMNKVIIPEDTDTSIIEIESKEQNEMETKDEKSSLLNQISEYAHPKQSDLLSAENKDAVLEDKSSIKDKNKSINQIDGVTKSNLTSIEGLGFDTISKLSNAKIAELTKINGIGKATARKIIQSAKSMIQELES